MIRCWNYRFLTTWIHTRRRRNPFSPFLFEGEEGRSVWEKEVVKSVGDPFSREDINEVKRVLSRSCHSSGQKNHSVDYKIILVRRMEREREGGVTKQEWEERGKGKGEESFGFGKSIVGSSSEEAETRVKKENRQNAGEDREEDPTGVKPREK